jgi:hypothetical protein
MKLRNAVPHEERILEANGDFTWADFDTFSECRFRLMHARVLIGADASATQAAVALLSLTALRTSRQGAVKSYNPRYSDPFHRHGKHISDAALGLDDARRARVALQLTAQP